MSSRRHFLHADKSFMENNMRFVENDLEENLNQYFDYSAIRGSNSTNFSAPARDYKFVQAKPDGSNAQSQSNDFEKRRGFLLKLGLARHDAYDLAKSSNFDAKRLENMYQQYFASGYRQDEAVSRILSAVRNYNNWVEDIMHEEQRESRKSPTVPEMSTSYNEQRNINFDHREFNKGFRDRSRSRSRSRSFDAYRNDQPSKSYIDDEYISRHVYNRDEERKEISRERSYSLMEGDKRNLRSRYQDRAISPRHFRDETRRTNTREERSRSYSSEKINNREHFELRACSPKNMINEDYPNRPFSPFRNEMVEERFMSSRSRSPNRRINEGCRPYSHSPTRMEHRSEHFHSSRSRSPNKRINEEYRSVNRRINEDHHQYFPSRNDDIEERYNSSRLPNKFSSPSRDNNQNINHFGDEVKYCGSSSSPMLDSKGNYHRTSGERSPLQVYSQHDILKHGNYDQLRSRDFSPPRNDPSTHDRSIPSLLTLNVHPEKMQHSKTSSHTLNISSLNSFPSELYNRKQNYSQSSRESYAEELYPQHDKSSHTDYKQHGFRKQLSTGNNPPSHNLNVPSLLGQNFFPEKKENSEAFIYNRNSSSGMLDDRTQNYHQSSREKILDRFYLEDDISKQSHSRSFSQPKKIQTHLDDYVSSSCSFSVHPDQKQQSQTSLRNRNFTSLPSFQLARNAHSMEQQTILKKPVLYSELSNEEIKKIDIKNGNAQIKPARVDKNETTLKKNIANVRVIPSGLAKPLPGFLKADPRDYWSKWWPNYKYIEYSVPKINPNDYDVKSCLYYLLKPNTAAARSHKLMLIEKSITTIMRTEDVNETNYFTLDIFKLFQYKQHLEDPNFQNSLTPAELNCIAPALRQFQIRTVMAFMHQSLIVKWHVSLEIMQKVLAGHPLKSNYARNLLNNKSFHYLVMVSIQELKKMCQQDWPEFTEFYKTIRAKKVDIYSFGVGPQCCL